MIGAIDWNLGSGKFVLKSNDVHVWRASQKVSADTVRDMHALLADDETKRAELFHFNADRDDYIVARGLLRVLLSLYTSIEPKKICFHYEEYGKPVLDYKTGNIDFNVSHSHGTVVFGFARNRDIGVDVEKVRTIKGAKQFIEEYFSEREKVEFAKLESGARDEAFFNWWTRKEAYIKAIGKGLYHPLNQFSVTLTPGQSAIFIDTFGDQDNNNWLLKQIPMDKNFVAAVVAKGRSWQMTCYDWHW